MAELRREDAFPDPKATQNGIKNSYPKWFAGFW